MAKKQGPTIIEMTEEELNALRERIKIKQLTEDDYPIFEKTIQFVLWVQIKLEHAKITMSKFKKLLFGSKTEKKKHSKNKGDNDSTKEKPAEQSTNETLDKPEPEKQGETNLVANQDHVAVTPLATLDDFKKKHLEDDQIKVYKKHIFYSTLSIISFTLINDNILTINLCT